MVEKKQEILRCKCTNNYSWLFWIIFLVMIGYLIYYIISTIEQLKANPEEFFETGYMIGGVLAWL